METTAATEMVNVTINGKHGAFGVFCSAERLPKGIQNQLKYLTTFTLSSSLTAFLGNALILAALRKQSSIHPPSKLLLSTLAVTDLFVGLISEPFFAVHLLSVVSERWNTCELTYAMAFIAGYILGSVSLLTLTAISLDRLLALLLGLRYQQVVTLKRTSLMIAIFWIVSIVAVTMYLENYFITLWYSYIGASLCLLTSFFSYSKIFNTLRQHQVRVGESLAQQPEWLTPRQMYRLGRQREAISCALWVQLTLLACYLPFIIDGVVSRAMPRQDALSKSYYFAKMSTVTVVYLNSSLNPILYCWKIRNVRRAVKDIIRKVVPC